MRELWCAHAGFDRRSYDEWEQKRDSARDWARERRMDTKDHRPTPLDAQAQYGTWNASSRPWRAKP